MFTTWCDLRAFAEREWVVLSAFEWRSDDAHVVVPRRFITDLASIPRPLRGLLDVAGPSREPAVLHDWLYCRQADAEGAPVTRRQADDLFRAALRAKGVSAATATVYWLGVRVGGGHYWGRRGRDPLGPDDFVPHGYLEQARL